MCLVGVQSNQFPRALDLARRFRQAGMQVAIGGFHVSGCLAMLPDLPAELQEALDLGITLFAGEAEGRFADLLRAAYERRLEPLYNFMADLPELQGQALPYLPPEVARRYAPCPGTFDAGRGCPFQCSFCTIINVQGRKSRFRDPDDIERLVRANLAQGIRHFFITDDNFARNRNWEAIFDRIARSGGNWGSSSTSPSRWTPWSHPPALHRQGAGGRGLPRLHRAGEHQPGHPQGRQQEAEQDHRLPRHAPGLAAAAGDHLLRLYPGLSGRHPGEHPARTSRSSSANCRSISWSSSA